MLAVDKAPPTMLFLGEFNLKILNALLVGEN